MSHLLPVKGSLPKSHNFVLENMARMCVRVSDYNLYIIIVIQIFLFLCNFKLVQEVCAYTCVCACVYVCV